MRTKTRSAIPALLAVISLITWCRPMAAASGTDPDGYFKTPFQTESQFIVQSIVSDIAEQTYYAAHHELPDRDLFSVRATAKAGSPADPVYELEVTLDGKSRPLKQELAVNGPIWFADSYRDMTTELAQMAGLSGAFKQEPGDTRLLAKLLDGTPETIERENLALSADLEKSFANPLLHEEAALLLGAFTLREYAGEFTDNRAALSRMTAHLAMAHYLRGTSPLGVNGQMAEAILLSVENDQVLSLKTLASMDANDAAVAAMARALRVGNTGDFRLLDNVPGRSRVESIIWFAAMAGYADHSSAWFKLTDEQKHTIDFVRAANAIGYTVETGHELLAESIPLERQEIQSIYELSHQQTLPPASLITALNVLPERCFTTAGVGQTQVRVIGWGQWAMFLQRHLCHAVQQNYFFLNSKLGDPEAAKEFAATSDKEFAGLRLYPFVRRFDCAAAASYHQAVDDALKVTVATPHLVSATCWGSLGVPASFAPSYKPISSLHLQQWYDHNPPPGTDYDSVPRLNLPGLLDGLDAVARLEQLHELAPYDYWVSAWLLWKKYDNRLTTEQAVAVLQPLLPYTTTALRQVAGLATNQPAQYEKLMLQAADLDPGTYYDLGNYWLVEPHKDRDKAERYFDEGADHDSNSVRASHFAHWRMLYYLHKGDTNKAREIADAAAETYSHPGLTTQGDFLEAISNYAGAFQCFAAIEERYGKPTQVIAFCLRYKAKTGDTRFDAELEKRVTALFPHGKETVTLASYTSAPTDGMLIRVSSESLGKTGLKKGDIIVAVRGIRVHDYAQYCYLRDSQKSSRLDMIVWQRDAYHEIRAVPPKTIGDDYNGINPSPAADDDR